MKKYIFAACIILLSIGFTVHNAIVLHGKYPDPQIQTFQYGETVQIGGYQITFSGWQWGLSDLLLEKCPGFVLVSTKADGITEDARIGLIELTITKTSAGGEALDLTDIAFSSGAWSNQFDAELYFLLNPEQNTMVMDMETGQVWQVILPITMLESQFPEAQWEHINSRKLFIDLQYYPQHIRFACPQPVS